MKLIREKKGQFIVIAALLLSIMIISVGTVIYGTVTYFRHERWEEYVTIVDSVKKGSNNLLEISLAQYSQTLNPTVLRDNLNQWIRDVRKPYPGFGVDLNRILESGVRSPYGMSLNYSLGLASVWNQKVSLSAANATFSLNIASVGLTGYSFSSQAFLGMNITDALWYSTSNEVSVRAIIFCEGLAPVTNLQLANFLMLQVDGTNKIFTLYRYYESRDHGGYPALNAFVYGLRYTTPSKPASINVVITVRDSRGIQITGAVNNLPVIDY